MPAAPTRRICARGMTLGAPSLDTPRGAAERRKGRIPYPPHGRCRFRDGPHRGARVFIKNDSLLTEVESCAPPRRPSRLRFMALALTATRVTAPHLPIRFGLVVLPPVARTVRGPRVRLPSGLAAQPRPAYRVGFPARPVYYRSHSSAVKGFLRLPIPPRARSLHRAPG